MRLEEVGAAAAAAAIAMLSYWESSPELVDSTQQRGQREGGGDKRGAGGC